MKRTKEVLTVNEITKCSPTIDTQVTEPIYEPVITPTLDSRVNEKGLFSTLFQGVAFPPKKVYRNYPKGNLDTAYEKETLMPLKKMAQRRTRWENSIENQDKSIENMQLVDDIETFEKVPKSIMTNASPERLAKVPTRTVQKMFSEMALPSWLIESLAGQNIVQPTKVQQQIIEGLLEETGPNGEKLRPILVKGQTGTGKSLGYIIALLANLHKERPARNMGEVASCIHLILVPNAILAQQLLRWIRTLVEGNAFLLAKFSTIVRVMIPEGELTEIDSTFPEDINKRGFSHILIATPNVARNFLATGQFNTSAIKNIIVDEADALLKPLSTYATLKDRLNRTRHPVPGLSILKDIYGACREYKLRHPRLTVASASLNRRCRDDLQESGLVTGAYTFITDSVKRSSTCPSSIKHYFRMLADAQSIEELIQLTTWIWNERSGETGVMFIPASQSKTSMKGWLEGVGIKCAILSDLPTGDQAALDKITADGTTLLLGSDIDARGWDLPMLKYVIIVDLPPTPTHYIHMAGRVGRMGAEGSVYTFVAGKQAFEKMTNIYSMLRITATPYIPA